MSGREIHIHITIGRRSLIVLGVVLALLAGGIVFAVVGTGDASAAATGNALCVKTNGTVVQRTACLTGERTLAAGTYQTSPLTARALRKGPNTMPVPQTATVSEAREGEEPPLVELDATTMFQSSLFAYTVRYDVPANWVGKITGTCPAYAPMFITAAFYSPEWQPILDGEGLGVGIPIPSPTSVTYYHDLATVIPGPGGGRVQIARPQSYLNSALWWANAYAWPLSPADPFTLYVTQVCGSIVALTPTG